MVKIVDFKERVSNEGKPFLALVVQGGVELIHSANGGIYATVRKASVASTFDEETCKGLIGTEIPGTIEKVECEQYEYTNPQTGEVLFLDHRYQFSPVEKKEGFVMVPEMDFSNVHNSF